MYCGPGIGDFILALPMAKAIKEANPDSYIKAICRSSSKRIVMNRQMLSLQHYIDELDYYSIQEPLHNIKLLIKNGFRRFDYGFGIQTSKNYKISVYPSRILNLAAKITYGFRTKNPNVKYDVYVDYSDGMRVAEIPYNILKAANIPPSFNYENLLDASKLPKVIKLNENEIGNRCVSLCVGTAPVSQKLEQGMVTNTPKRWPYDYWIELAIKLAKQNWNVFLLGGKAELKDFSSLLYKNLPDNVKNFIGSCSILESLSILNCSELVIGADTGLMHCAGALGVKTITLFGCTDFKEYLPIGKHSYFIASDEPCSPCFGSPQSVLCQHHNCMKHITVDHVLDKIKEILQK